MNNLPIPHPSKRHYKSRNFYHIYIGNVSPYKKEATFSATSLKFLVFARIVDIISDTSFGD